LSSYDLSEFTEEEVAELRASLGIDDPLLVRYGRYMFRLIQGDLGVSDINGYKFGFIYVKTAQHAVSDLLFLYYRRIYSDTMGVRAARKSEKSQTT
jgi:hypothetical protein